MLVSDCGPPNDLVSRRLQLGHLVEAEHHLAAPVRVPVRRVGVREAHGVVQVF